MCLVKAAPGMVVPSNHTAFTHDQLTSLAKQACTYSCKNCTRQSRCADCAKHAVGLAVFANNSINYTITLPCGHLITTRGEAPVINTITDQCWSGQCNATGSLIECEIARCMARKPAALYLIGSPYDAPTPVTDPEIDFEKDADMLETVDDDDEIDFEKDADMLETVVGGLNNVYYKFTMNDSIVG